MNCSLEEKLACGEKEEDWGRGRPDSCVAEPGATSCEGDRTWLRACRFLGETLMRRHGHKIAFTCPTIPKELSRLGCP